ncbi:SMP-30/gluconolactonase/LRE family protein [Ruania albidiflava]|uniref:SMP-30/gluconolactonase/LRE family protein n=1 Tax=Ruania albidiflava TaxID=366586 RepID=UPI0023F2FC83|nr:SMP-30/gluconolactonase/LRE family protein [Ruania albidiflava]
MKAEQFSDVVTGHGEGPVWWPDAGLRVCDGFAGRIRSLDETGRVVADQHVGTFVGAFRPRESGGLVASNERSFVLIDEAGSVQDLGELWSSTRLRMNDGGCDPQGRFYCGSMTFSGDSPEGVLYRLSPDGQVEAVLDNLFIPNGLVYSADGALAYFIDTGTHAVRVYEVDEDGSWGAMRIVADLAGRSPDGMTIDAAGNLWVALWGAGRVVCLDPVSGREVESIEVDAATQTSACAFGGADLDQLFITTSAQDGAGGPHGGAVFVASPGVRGRLPEPFAG